MEMGEVIDNLTKITRLMEQLRLLQKNTYSLTKEDIIKIDEVYTILRTINKSKEVE